MEAVGDLTRLRRAFMGALGKRTATIAADHLDVRMLLKPIRCRARRTNRQKVDHFPPLQVHDDGSVSGALAPRPVIDPDHPNVCLRAPLLCSPLEMAQNRIIAGRHADALHHALAWPAPQRDDRKDERVPRLAGFDAPAARQTQAIVPQTFAAGTLCCGIASAAREVDRLPQPGQEPNSSWRAKMIQRSSIRSAPNIHTPGPSSHAEFLFIKPGQRSQRIESSQPQTSRQNRKRALWVMLADLMQWNP